jgi:hypothetical protein
MTDAERFCACLSGEAVDRVPFGYGLGWRPWGESMERWRRETGQDDLDVGAELGFDPPDLVLPVKLGFHPLFERQVLAEDGETVTVRDERGIVSRGRKDGHSIPEFLDCPVKGREDWERLKGERLRIDDAARTACDWSALAEEAKESGRIVQLGSFPNGFFGTPRDLLGVEDLLMAYYDDPEMMHDITDHLAALWTAVIDEAAKHVDIHHLHIWEDMSGRHGSLISPAMVEDFMMPGYDRMVDSARRNAIPVISVDTDGDCSELIPPFTAHGITMMFPFEAQAGNDLLAIREEHPELGMVGGLDKRALAEGKNAIDRQVELAARMVEKGRYIPAWDHLIPPDVSWENFAYAAEQLSKICGV